MTARPIIIAAWMLTSWPGLGGAAAACTESPGQVAGIRLGGVDAAGDPLLSDGRSLRLVGLAPRQDASESTRFGDAIAGWRDRELILVPAGERDRWGRLPVRLLVPAADGAGQPRDLATLLIASGAATRLPEAAHAGCGVPVPAVRQPSRKPTPARQAASVASISAGMLDGHDVAALKAQAGRLVAVEGRIASVGERPYRVYLNFSRRRAEAGAVMMTRKIWREMQQAGWTASSLSGKRIRARGILSGQDGLLLEVTSALALELID